MMPIHNWSRLNSGVVHHFHQDWTIEIARALNRGLLPKGFSALAEQRAFGMVPDVLTLQRYGQIRDPNDSSDTTVTALPQTRFVRRTTAEIYAGRGNRIVIRHALGRVVAIIEIISPGNKESRTTLNAFVQKTIEFLQQGVHVLVIDLFPPGRRDPSGIHKLIWDELVEEPFELLPEKPLTLVSYRCGEEITAYIELVGVGDSLPDMAIFLDWHNFVYVPLEATYQTAFAACPEDMRQAVERGEMPIDSDGT